ncbi:MAG: protein phosphatase 2C domain-containing protein, partial [Cyanobacteria bacterium P01_C01_bin.118]
PQPYAFIEDQGLLLLDTAAIAASPGEIRPTLLPSLVDAWPKASPLRQLNWLWQIAELWPDFLEQQVASSLVASNHLRVHGSLVRLLELNPDPQPLNLGNLGAFWKKNLLLESHSSIREFLDPLCQGLIDGEITTPEFLLGYLDQAIATAGDGYQVDYELSVLTDQGPSRKRNEDACSPPSGTTQIHSLGPRARAKHRRPLLLLVCDGIGGHEGGDIASRLAIATIEQELAPLSEWLADQPLHDAGTVTLAIEQAIGAANDQISHYNDQGQRQARDRMGTTIVMALIVGVYVYIAHVGDSRAYRISTNSCRQITFDDDVAAREVRLGYGFYADVANRPGTGALIQALGMGHSAALHTAVQRLILDDDLVLLLCSDGLSDYDRVEQSWQTHLLPILTERLKPTKAVKGLVQLANTYNGHDNITVGVVSAQIKLVQPPLVPFPSSITPAAPPSPRPSKPPVAATQQIPAPPQESPLARSTNSIWPVLLGLFGTLGAATALIMIFFREEPAASPPNAAPILPETIQDKINQDIERVGISDDELASPSLAPRSYLQLTQPLSLLTAPQLTADDDTVFGQILSGTVVQVLTRQELAGEQSRWIKLKVCGSAPLPTNVDTPEAADDIPPSSELTVTPSTVPSLTSGAEGWVLEAELAQLVRTAESCPSDF